MGTVARPPPDQCDGLHGPKQEFRLKSHGNSCRTEKGPMRRRLLLVFCFASTVLFSTGCRLQDSDLVGTYHAAPEWGSSVLVLAADHTFTQTITTKSGAVKQINGRWETSGLSRIGGNVALAPYLTVTHEIQGEEAGGDFATVQRRLFGGLEISADPDWGISFQK